MCICIMLIKTKFWDPLESTKCSEEKHNHPLLLCTSKIVEVVRTILIVLTSNFPEAVSASQVLLPLNSNQPPSLLPLPSSLLQRNQMEGLRLTVSCWKLVKGSRSWVSNVGVEGGYSSNYNSTCVCGKGPYRSEEQNNRRREGLKIFL